jgi:hypothetical protein
MKTNQMITAKSLILAFTLAVSGGRFAECQSLIQQGAYVHSRDEYGNPPLMMAVVRLNRVKLARMLLRAGEKSPVQLLPKFEDNSSVATRSGYTPRCAFRGVEACAYTTD